jgi:Mg/Co/Ni transporter MgtE
MNPKKIEEVVKTYEEDFVSDEPKTVEIDGRVFKIRELTGREMDEVDTCAWRVNDITQNDVSFDMAARNEELLRRSVIDAPYNDQKSGKSFKELKPDERVALLQSLKNRIRAKLLAEISKINGIKEEELKK